MDFLSARLGARPELLPALDEFYGDFGAPLAFTAMEGDPYYHVAFLVPGDRFEAAFEWARGRYELQPRQDGELVFDFSFWDALACYFLDPAGSIVELIAHRGFDENGARGPFSPEELLGFSEIGLVGDVAAMARDLEGLDLRVWSGSADDPASLVIVGEKARTLILCPVGRGWLPIGKRAEPHAVDVALSGPPEGALTVGGHHVTRR